MTSHLLAAAIDLGTSFSTTAFSFKHEYERDKLNVHCKNWKNIVNVISQKAPTCILIRPDDTAVFGYDAMQTYINLTEENAHHDYYFFQNFKMQLYTRKIDRNLKLKDISGKLLPAKKVFALAIQCLKDDLLETTNKSIIKSEDERNDSGEKNEDGIAINDVAEGDNVGSDKQLRNIESGDVQWVLTVPAIWDDSAKQFMREAAIEADIPSNQLCIALEPEAASIYCRLLPAVDCRGSMSGLQPGHKYLILDAGGGTIDITVHEVGAQGSLKELHKASGGGWGGELVNQNFRRFLEALLGPETMKSFNEQFTEDYVQMMNDFEIKKRLGKNDIDMKVTVKIPAALADCVKDNRKTTIKELIQTSSFKDSLKIQLDKLRIDYALVRSFYDTSIEKTSTHVAEILYHADVQGCDTILMVGGFSESIILQEEIRKRFPLINVVVPTDPELVIIKGAVLFGHDPSIIVQRRMKYTYGTNVVHDKDDSCTHPPTPVIIIAGKPHCTDIFSAHVHAGDVVKLDEEIAGMRYFPANPLASMTEVSIYKSTEVNPHLVTEESSTLVGILKLKITPMFLSLLLGRSSDDIGFSVTFMFGGTELKVRGVDNMTGRNVEVSLDCLDNDTERAAEQK